MLASALGLALLTACSKSPSSPTSGSTTGSTGDGNSSSAPASALTITATWDVLADLDLHVIDPTGTEIWWFNPGPTSSGGQLVTDGDNDCKQTASGNKEVVQWPTSSPNGTYTVKLDYYNSCGVSAANYTVTISDGKTTLPSITGTFSGNGDVNSSNGGIAVKTFTHVGTAFQ
ncbi:MAG TPA: hypothetical protein VHZ73_01655 [Vicinamibacterales bacterium]|nr:hypothetical protein [Vicinamibacterales bacterium]